MEMPDMKDRIAHIIRAKNMTAAEFALSLGIQPSNVSHLLAGRNNPSLEFVKKLKETFPEYNLDWIVFGKGSMTVSEPFVVPKTIAEPVEQSAADSKATTETVDGTDTLFAAGNAPLVKSLPNDRCVLKHIILVYDDNSFEVLTAR